MNHTFNGKWITDEEFCNLEPRNVFHRQLDVKTFSEEHANSHVLFRKKFNLDIKPSQATIFITADDYYKLYINGRLVGEADYGTGSFKNGLGDDFILGLGYNPQYNASNKEAISNYVDYELYEARIYETALTDEQVAQQYWNTIDTLLKEAGNE